MAELIQPVRGMNDILPADAATWERIETAAAQLFRAYGYRQMRLPVLERTELFKRSIGELTDIVEKEMYTFEDRNGESVTMRPEATAGVVRAALSTGVLHNQPQKLWVSGPMFRHERPQKGRYRQFHQLSLEALGFSEPEIDAELIVISARLWEALGISSLKLEMNSLGTLEARANYKSALHGYFTAHKESLDEDSMRRLDRSPMRILDSKNPAMQAVVADAPALPDYLDDESRDHFERVKTLLGDVGISFELNPRLVRGLDYYSRTVFEWITDKLGAQSAVCSGGRYDGLVTQLGGRDTPAVGWALGIERVADLMRADAAAIDEPGPDVYAISVDDPARRECFRVSEILRRRFPELKVVAGQPSASFKSQLRRADKSGALFAIIIGDSELAAGKVTLKPLRGGSDQAQMSESQLIERLAAEFRPVQ
jgi:histidyl-tRNA synthetase